VASASQVYRELPVLVAIGGTQVAGVIDLLFEDADGGWHLVDYKSRAAEDAEEAAEPYRLQLGVYVLAAGRWLGRPIETAGVYLVESAMLVENDAAQEGLDEVEKEASRIFAAIAAREFGPVPKKTCPPCRYHRVCGGGQSR
jgi:RecB family exonuclease